MGNNRQGRFRLPPIAIILILFFIIYGLAEIRESKTAYKKDRDESTSNVTSDALSLNARRLFVTLFKIEESKTAYEKDVDESASNVTLDVATSRVSLGKVSIKKAKVPATRTFMGCAEDSSSHIIYCFGGYNDSVPNVDEIDAYDPFDDTITVKKAVLSGGRAYPACAENSVTHLIYCFGGRDQGTFFKDIIEYNPARDTIKVMNAVLPHETAHFSCVENSKTHLVYCFGGGTPDALSDQIVEYDPAIDKVTMKNATLPSPRYQLRCAEDSSINKIYCFGGADKIANGAERISRIVEYDPVRDRVTIKTALLPRPVRQLGCAEDSSSHMIYCFGGDDASTGFYNDLIQYDPKRDVIQTDQEGLSHNITGTACVENSLTNNIFCFGGGTGSEYFDEVSEYPHSFLRELW